MYVNNCENSLACDFALIFASCNSSFNEFCVLHAYFKIVFLVIVSKKASGMHFQFQLLSLNTIK